METFRQREFLHDGFKKDAVVTNIVYKNDTPNNVINQILMIQKQIWRKKYLLCGPTWNSILRRKRPPKL